MDQLLTADDVAQLLKVKKCTVYQLSSRGAIPTVKIGGILRFLPDQLAKWLHEHHQPKIDAAGSPASGENDPTHTVVSPAAATRAAGEREAR